MEENINVEIKDKNNIEKNEIKNTKNYSLIDITSTFFKTLLILHIVLMIFPMIGFIAVILDIILIIFFGISNLYITGKRNDKKYDEKRFDSLFKLKTSVILLIFSFISVFFDFGCIGTTGSYMVLSIIYALCVFLPLMILYIKKVNKIKGNFKELNKIFISYILTLIVVGIIMIYIAKDIDEKVHTIVA